MDEPSTEDDATHLYLSIIRMADPSRELLLAQGMPAARVDAALALLQGRGLVTVTPHGPLVVPSPATALPGHATQLERKAKSIRASAYELTQVYLAARSAEGDAHDEFGLLYEVRDVGDASNLAVSQARASVRSLRGLTSRTQELLDAPLASHREPTIGAHGDPVELRTVWDVRVLEQPGAMEMLEARAEGGEQQRFLPLSSISVLLVDDTSFLAEWTSTKLGLQGVHGSSPGPRRALAGLFDRLWQLAAPAGRLPVSPELDERDATILRLLAAGVSDASIARQTGFSQRTVERRIRQLMDRLGAQTRFQAAVQAVHRSWL